MVAVDSFMDMSVDRRLEYAFGQDMDPQRYELDSNDRELVLPEAGVYGDPLKHRITCKCTICVIPCPDRGGKFRAINRQPVVDNKRQRPLGTVKRLKRRRKHVPQPLIDPRYVPTAPSLCYMPGFNRTFVNKDGHAVIMIPKGSW